MKSLKQSLTLAGASLLVVGYCKLRGRSDIEAAFLRVMVTVSAGRMPLEPDLFLVKHFAEQEMGAVGTRALAMLRTVTGNLRVWREKS